MSMRDEKTEAEELAELEVEEAKAEAEAIVRGRTTLQLREIAAACKRELTARMGVSE